MWKFSLFWLLVLSPEDQKVARQIFSFGQCLDGHGKPVDFFYGYKLPKIKNELEGYDFSYITSDSVDAGWKRSSLTLKDEGNLVAKTLEVPMSKDTHILLAYNDEEPEGGKDDVGGHTKGVFATDGKQGFWFIHSVPKFPDLKQYSYPDNAVKNGQSFLCISVGSSEIEKIGSQFLFNEVNIYDSKIPEGLKGKFKNIEDAIGKKWRTEGPYQSLLEIESLNGTTFLSFAKGRNFLKELYVDWVAPQLGTDLLTETWRNGPGALPSNCSFSNRFVFIVCSFFFLLNKNLKHSSRSVFNIKRVEFQGEKIEFSSTVDHSKWAIGNGEPWICVGDINRAEHQEVRGGGTVCLKNIKLAEHYRKLVEDYEPCVKL